MKNFVFFPRLLVLIVAGFMLCACARPQQPGGTLLPMAESDALWQRYTTLGSAAAKPFREQLSLRYGTEGDTRRVTALLWGNNASQLRLDVNAGVGVTIAKILEDGDHFLVFAPNENRAYYHQGRQKPLLHVGVPMPLGLRQLAELINGHYSNVFGEARSSEAVALQNGDVRYKVEEGRMAGSLELNAQGLPVRWREAAAQGWDLQISYDEGQSLPHKLEISHAKTGKRAIVLVKDRQNPSAPFTEAQMRLTLPEGTPVLPLSKFRQS